jgi:hypothetical protein
MVVVSTDLCLQVVKDCLMTEYNSFLLLKQIVIILRRVFFPS